MKGRKCVIICPKESKEVRLFKISVAERYGLKIITQNTGRRSNNSKDRKKSEELIKVKDEFKSEYINFENGVETKVEIRSDETKIIRNKKDKDGTYPVYEFSVVETNTGKLGKISLFKGDVVRMYKQVDETTGKDNKSLIGLVFNFKNTITEVDGKTKYDLSINLVKPSVDSVISD